MMRALFTAASGLNAQKLNVDVIANNLANVNTVGFKRQKIEFQDLIYEDVCPGTSQLLLGIERPVPTEFGTGVRTIATTRIFSQGPLKETCRNLDVAIQGEGFFQIECPDGRTAYTRNGEFHVNSKGELTTADGLRVLPPISFPPDTKFSSIAFAPDGTVFATLRDEPDSRVQVGRIELALFRNPEGLKAIGSNLLTETQASGGPDRKYPGDGATGQLIHHYVELSNVNVVQELVNMIVAQRAYEVNSKAIRTSDDMLATANNLVR
jgi:flagellar basal-body rod protein FlgG